MGDREVVKQSELILLNHPDDQFCKKINLLLTCYIKAKKVNYKHFIANSLLGNKGKEIFAAHGLKKSDLGEHAKAMFIKNFTCD